MSGVTNAAKIEAYIGQSGSGKGVSLKARLRDLKPRRLVIWDPRDEYDGLAVKVIKVAGAVAAMRKPTFRVRLVLDVRSKMKPADAFGWLCEAAFVAGDLVFLAEELSDVTTAGYAPPKWRQVITQGRHRGLHVLAAAQRPALIDKTLLGNCTYIRCFSLRYRNDRQAMADAMDIPVSDVQGLVTSDDGGRVSIAYIERDFPQRVLRKGFIRLTR